MQLSFPNPDCRGVEKFSYTRRGIQNNLNTGFDVRRIRGIMDYIFDVKLFSISNLGFRSISAVAEVY